MYVCMYVCMYVYIYIYIYIYTHIWCFTKNLRQAYRERETELKKKGCWPEELSPPIL